MSNLTSELDDLTSDIIREMLIDLNLSVDEDSSPWPTFCEGHPTEPEQLICVYETSGILNDSTQYGEYSEYYGIQIKARDSLPNLGSIKLKEIVKVLDALANRTVNLGGVNYLVHCMDRKSGIIPLGGSNEERRFSHTVNYVCPISKEV